MSTGAFLRRPIVLLLAGLCAVAAVATVLGRLTSSGTGAEKRTTLAGVNGPAAYPSFSPDGDRLAYCEKSDSAAAFHVFVRRLPSGAPQQLTSGAGSEISPAWSPDGSQIAFLRIRDGRAQAVLIPSAGGAERKVAEFVPGESPEPLPMLNWTRDGKWLVTVSTGANELPAITKLAVDHSEARRITAPAEGSEGDWSPVVSPDGTWLAFSRAGSSESADIYICDLEGNGLRRLTFDDRAIRGLTWMPHGRELIYGAAQFGGVRMFRLAIDGGGKREIFISGDRSRYPSASQENHRLVYVDSPSIRSIWRASLDPAAPGEQRLSASSVADLDAVYSPDAQRVASISRETGATEIWLSDLNGANRQQLTHLNGAQPGSVQWSPDGQWLLFDTRGNGGQVYKILAQSGAKPVRLVNSGIAPSWSHDGKSIYYQQGPRIWKARADGTNQSFVTPQSGNTPAESVDGKFIYFRSRRSIWRAPVNGGSPEELVSSDRPFIGTRIIPTQNGIYYAAFDREDRAPVLIFYSFATHHETAAYKMRASDLSPWSNFSISPDGKFVLYSKLDANRTNLVLVENFR